MRVRNLSETIDIVRSWKICFAFPKAKLSFGSSCPSAVSRARCWSAGSFARYFRKPVAAKLTLPASAAMMAASAEEDRRAALAAAEDRMQIHSSAQPSAPPTPCHPFQLPVGEAQPASDSAAPVQVIEQRQSAAQPAAAPPGTETRSQGGANETKEPLLSKNGQCLHEGSLLRIFGRQAHRLTLSNSCAPAHPRYTKNSGPQQRRFWLRAALPRCSLRASGVSALLQLRWMEQPDM